MPTQVKLYDGQGLKTTTEFYYIYPAERLIQIVKDRNGHLVEGDFYTPDYQKSVVMKAGRKETKEVVELPLPIGSILKERINGGEWQWRFRFSNHQSSLALVTGKNGQLIPGLAESKRIFYFPYGLMISNLDLSALPTKQTYTGQYYDNNIGLYYYNSRYYNPNLGVFVQADSVQDGLNRYIYVGGNPVMMEDPNGTDPVGALIGGAGGFLWSVGSQLVTKGEVKWERVAVDTAIGACFGATDGIGAVTGACYAGGAALETAYNHFVMKENMKEAVVNAAVTTVGSAVLGEVGGRAVRGVGKVGGKVVSKTIDNVASNIAYKTYGRWGHSELIPAIEALRSGSYEQAIKRAEMIAREADSSFEGFKFVKFDDPHLGGLSGGLISEDMPLPRRASLVVHETVHILNRQRKGWIIGNHKVSLSHNYGLFARRLMTDEMMAYGTELAGGVKGVKSVAWGFNYSVSPKVGGLMGGIKAVLLEGGIFPK